MFGFISSIQVKVADSTGCFAVLPTDWPTDTNTNTGGRSYKLGWQRAKLCNVVAGQLGLFWLFELLIEYSFQIAQELH